MTELETILLGVTAFSLLLTAFVFIYARSAISRLLYVSEELGDLKNSESSYKSAIKFK